jgi:hypothetical protein
MHGKFFLKRVGAALEEGLGDENIGGNSASPEPFGGMASMVVLAALATAVDRAGANP